MKMHRLKLLLGLSLACGAFAGVVTHDVPDARAWPVASYDQFDGMYIVDGCSNPRAHLNIVIGGAEGDPLDPLGLEPGNEPLEVMAIPFVVPIPMECVDGQPQVDLGGLGDWVGERCTDNGLQGAASVALGVPPADACGALADGVRAWAGDQRWHLSPELAAIDFDWHANGFTWLLGNNVSSSRYLFGDGHEATVLQNLVRKTIGGQWWLPDDERATYTNFFDSGGYHEELDPIEIPGTDLELTCIKGMVMHTHGSVDVSEVPGTTTAEMDLLPMVNCVAPVGHDGDEFLGLHMSVSMQYDITASR